MICLSGRLSVTLQQTKYKVNDIIAFKVKITSLEVYLSLLMFPPRPFLQPYSTGLCLV